MKKIFMVLITLFISSSIFAENMEIYGKVVDSATKKGIEDAQIIIFPGGQKAKTKANGNFFLEVEKADGMFVQILKKGYKSIKITDNINEIYAELTLTTQVTGQRVMVRGKKDKKKVVISKSRVNREMIKRTTSQLFGDAVAVVKTMPGVVSMGDFSALMYVRGGEFYETASFYDRLFLLQPYVWGGHLSVFNPEVVGNIDFYSGAFPAEYGNSMSGVMDVKMRDGENKWQGMAELSMTNLQFAFEGPLGESGKTNDTFLIALRRTHYDLIMNQISDADGVQFPYFYDAHIRFKFHLDQKNIFRIFSLIVLEGMEFSFDADPDGESTEGWKEGNEFNYKDFRFLQGFSLTTAFSKKLTMENTLGYNYHYGKYQYVDADNPMDIKEHSHYFQYRLDINWRPNDSHIIKTGVGGYLVNHSLDLDIIVKGLGQGFYDSDKINDDTDPYNANQIPTQTFTQDYKSKWFFIPAFYVQDDIELAKDFLFLNLGARTQWFNVTKEATIDPRAGLKFAFSDEFAMKLAVGKYSQYPTSIAHGRVFNEDYGNTDIKAEKSYHGVLGFEYDTSDYFFRVDFFGKYYDDLVNEDYDYNYVNGTIGYSYGFDVFLQKKISKRLDGWIAYSFIMTKKKIEQRTPYDQSKHTNKGQDYELPFNTWYSPEYDRRHTLNIILNYTFHKKWKLATSTKFGTGLPYTALGRVDKYYVDGDNANNYNANDSNDYIDYVPNYGKYNSQRLPFYFKMDVKLSMPFFWDNWESYIQVVNLFNRTNVQGYYYDETYTKRRETKLMPRYIIFGFKGRF